MSQKHNVGPLRNFLEPVFVGSEFFLRFLNVVQELIDAQSISSATSFTIV